MNKTPWQHKKANDDNSIVDADGRAFICDAQYYPWVRLSDDEWSLIAAAPELLEALEDIINQWPYIACPHGPNHPRIPSHQIEKARAAIAKARGIQ